MTDTSLIGTEVNLPRATPFKSSLHAGHTQGAVVLFQSAGQKGQCYTMTMISRFPGLHIIIVNLELLSLNFYIFENFTFVRILCILACVFFYDFSKHSQCYLSPLSVLSSFLHTG